MQIARLEKLKSLNQNETPWGFSRGAGKRRGASRSSSGSRQDLGSRNSMLLVLKTFHYVFFVCYIMFWDIKAQEANFHVRDTVTRRGGHAGGGSKLACKQLCCHSR